MAAGALAVEMMVFITGSSSSVFCQFVEKASQSFAPAGAKAVKSVFPGSMYVGKNTLRGVSGELAALRPTEAQSAAKPPRKSDKVTFSMESCEVTLSNIQFPVKHTLCTLRE